ncbi:MAG: hypothetical protein ABI565_09860, partial [Vicinamibacteria bacterium]
MSATPLLRRFDIVTFKNKSGSDTAQVPTAATVNIYRQGATYRGSTITISPSDPDPTTIDVDDIGDIVVSDTLGTNTATACFIVNAIISTTQLQLSSISGSQTLSDNDRLVVTTNQPTIYSDSRGNTSTSNPLTADGATGRAQVYVKNKRFDYIVTGLGTGVPARLFRNAEGGSIPEAFLNLNDYASLKQAIAALPATGGKILAPQGTYTLDGSDLEVAFNKPIHLIGAGAGATTFQVQATAGNKNKDLFRIESAFCSIEDCRLVGVGNQGGSPGSGVGIKIGYPNDPEVKVYGIVIRNVIVQDFAN